MELGNTEIAIRNLMQLNAGFCVELDRFAWRAARCISKCTFDSATVEVVVVNDKYVSV